MFLGFLAMDVCLLTFCRQERFRAGESEKKREKDRHKKGVKNKINERHD